MASWRKSHTWVISPGTILRTKSAWTKKSSGFLFWSQARLSWLTFHMCFPADKHTPVRKVTSSPYSCFLLVLPESSPNAFSTRKTDTGWGRDAFNPTRTDIGRLQLHWMTARDFDGRVLKCRNDFSNRVPLNVNATHLKIRVWTQTSTCIRSGTGNAETCTKQERVNWIAFNKRLPGWWMNCVENSSQMPSCSRDTGSAVCKEPLKHPTAHGSHTWCSLQLGLVAKT